MRGGRWPEPEPDQRPVFPLIFEIRGAPGAQGSKKSIRHRSTGKPVLFEELHEKVQAWRQDVRAEAQRVMAGRPPLTGPLMCSLVFTVRKPKSAPKRRRTWPMKTPDLSKILRSTEDALTGIAWLDDAQVVEYIRLAKVYPPDAMGYDVAAQPAPGALLTITPMTAQDPAFWPALEWQTEDGP